MQIINTRPPSTEYEYVYLDMDGVLCNTGKALLALHGRMDLLDQTDDHTLPSLLGITPDELFQPVVDAGWEWWDEIEPFPWTFELWAWAHEVSAEVYILSRPLMFHQLGARDVGYSARGKMSWIRRHFGRKFFNVIFTPCKHVVSQPGAILVDDDDRYAAGFNRAGGHQIIFPGAHNSFSDFRYAPMDSVRDQYQKLRSS